VNARRPGWFVLVAGYLPAAARLAATDPLFDHLVGAGDQRRRNFEPECFAEIVARLMSAGLVPGQDLVPVQRLRTYFLETVPEALANSTTGVAFAEPPPAVANNFAAGLHVSASK
jgi:hypothetical protein